MKHVSNLINIDNYKKDTEDKHGNSSAEPQDGAGRLVDYVFSKFYVICRGFNKHYEDFNRLRLEKAQWIDAFTRLKYFKIIHVQHALEKLDKYQHPIPPQLGVFLSWNDPSANNHGFLSKQQAYVRAFELMRNYSHEPSDLSQEQILIIRHAISQTGHFEMRSLPEKSSRPLFEHMYETAINDFISGKLKPIPKQVETGQEAQLKCNKNLRVSAEDAKCTTHEAAMARMRSILGIRD